MTQRNKEVCPNDKCRYVFASAELFSQYYNMAEASLRNGDFDSARQYIFKSQTVAPGEKDRINQLSRKIDETEIIHKQPINKIRGLIAERKYQAAQKFLGEIIRNYPTLNVSTFEATIRTELGKADSLFSSAKDYPPSKKADVCVSVLLQCYDHAPSIAFLRSTPPISCNSIFLKPDSTSGTINVSWNRSQEQGVNYRLVRKAGANAPLSENDGTVLLDSTGQHHILIQVLNLDKCILILYLRRECMCTPLRFQNHVCYIPMCRISILIKLIILYVLLGIHQKIV